MNQSNLLSDVELLRVNLASAEIKVTRQAEQISQNEKELSCLREMLVTLKRQKFGSKKETWISNKQDVMIFNEAETEAKKPQPDSSSEEIEVKGFKRKRGKRKPLPANLPREVVTLELPEAERFSDDGRPLKVIGKEVSEKLIYEPAVMKVVEYHRLRYGIDFGDPIKTAPVVPSIIPKGIATPSLLSSIVVNKYADGLPLYRQEEIFSRLDVELSRSTMARWIIQSAKACVPILNVLEERLLSHNYIACDETHTQVLKEKNRNPENKSWMWLRTTPSAEQPIAIFDYDPHRSGEVAKRLFADYEGFLQVDGYSAYNVLEKQKEIVRIGCNMHGRRRFFEATEGAKEGRSLAEQGVSYYQRLYEIEEKAKTEKLSPSDRKTLRDAQAIPIWNEMKTWAEENAQKVPPKSKIGQAFHYFLNEIEYLQGYLKDGILEMDNGFAERAIRKFAIGRNNWLFSDTEDGAEASSLFYSLIVTAKINGVNPYSALKQIFEQIPLARTIDDYERLANLLFSKSILH